MAGKTCPKCGRAMHEGFVVDASHYNVPAVGQWHPGSPIKSIWSGLKLDKKAKKPIVTYRCGGCGFLESYAP